MSEKEEPDAIPKCPLCNQRLYGPNVGAWIDDEDYGDVHVECLAEVKPE